MSSIRIQSPHQTWTAEQARVFRIGRDGGSDIVASDPTVSRNHAEIRPLGEGWEVVDLGSAQGTWVNGHRVQRADLTGTTVVGLGENGRALSLTVTVTGVQAPPAPMTGARPAGPAAPAPLAPTMITGPGGLPGLPGVPGSGGPGLLVRRRVGGDLRFPPGTLVRVGRDPGLEVVADDAAVSRQHAAIEPRPDGWWWVDRSTTGSFVDGERVTTFKLEEPVEISLGHPTAGYEIEVVPVVDAQRATATINRRKRRRTLGLVAAAVGALVLVGGGVAAAVVLGQDDDTSQAAGGDGPERDEDSLAELTPEELDRAKAASVLLIAYDSSGQPTHTGSGSIISEDGLILTNAHVAQPSAPGQGPTQFSDPDYLAVALTNGADDVPASPTFRAEPIVTDGYLDLSVVKITGDIDGAPVEVNEMNLPTPMPLGDSDALRTGDEITALGYPSLAGLASDGDGITQPLTVTKGVVATFKRDDIVDSDRAQIDSDVRIGSGNSGGASINNDGELVGVNSAVITSQTVPDGAGGAFTGGSALIRPVNLAAEVIEIAEGGGDPEYVSPYVEEMPDVPDTPVDATIESAGWAPQGSEGQCQGGSSLDEPQISSIAAGDVLHAEFLVSGMADGTPFAVNIVQSDDPSVVLGAATGTWEYGTDTICYYVSFEAPPGVPGMNAVFVLGDSEVVAENPLLFQ